MRLKTLELQSVTVYQPGINGIELLWRELPYAVAGNQSYLERIAIQLESVALGACVRNDFGSFPNVTASIGGD